MTSTLATARDGADPAGADPAADPSSGASSRRLDRPEITALDLLAGGAVVALALVGWVSLALANVGAHSLPAVAAVSLAAVAVVVLLARRVRVRADTAGVAVALLCAVAAALLTYPGFSYGATDRDPGVYVAHAIEISRTGDFSFIDPVLATRGVDPTFPVQITSPGARFPGVWIADDSTGKIIPQFYHLWPALLATAYDAKGLFGLRLMTPLTGVGSVLVLCALLRRLGDALVSRAGPGPVRRRAAGLVAAGAGGLLIATNMLQVWQARYPTTEIMAQALYIGALLGVVVALQTGWRPAAGLAGLLVGVGWLNRADGMLLVLLAAGAGAALIATRRWDSRATWFAAGLAVVTPHALVQAYDYAGGYTAANGVPSLSLLAGILVMLLVAALALRLVARRPLDWAQAALTRLRPELVIGAAVVLVVVALVLVGFNRTRLFGEDYFLYGAGGVRYRSYDDQILPRLTWFFSYPFWVLAGGGLALVALRRWRASLWAVVLPTLFLFALYGYTGRNSTRLLWWSRRYVPTVLPGLVILVALALAYLAVRRYRGYLLTAVPAAVALVGLVGYFLTQSLPLRQHDEWRGSFAVSERIAALSGSRQGVYLWEYNQGCCANTTRLFATPLWLEHGEVSTLLPSDAAYQMNPDVRENLVERMTERFSGQPVFIVADAPELPAGIDPAQVRPVDRFAVKLPMWEESDVSRPNKVNQIDVQVSVWQVRGT